MAGKTKLSVSAIVQKEDQFLMVIERTPHGQKINFPTGQVEPGETFNKALIREVKEETGFAVNASALLRMYQITDSKDVLSLTYVCSIKDKPPSKVSDKNIVSTTWLSKQEILESKRFWKNSTVGDKLKDFEKAVPIPNSIVKHIKG